MKGLGGKQTERLVEGKGKINSFAITIIASAIRELSTWKAIRFKTCDIREDVLSYLKRKEEKSSYRRGERSRIYIGFGRAPGIP